MKTLVEAITALHAHPAKIVLVCTGAGAGCQNIIAQVPGSSSTLLECMFPYSNEALVDFLGFVPEKFASEETAQYMAVRAWRRAAELIARTGGNAARAVGIGVTGALATNRLLRGEHRVCIAARTADSLYTARVVFAKNKEGASVLGRLREGELSDILALNIVLHAIGIGQVPVPAEALSGDITTNDDGAVLLPRLIAPQISLNTESHTLIGTDGAVVLATGPDPARDFLFDGSFDPLHFGHERAAREAERLTGKKVIFTITDRHPVKGVVDRTALLERVRQFHLLAPVLVTHGLRLYLDKARAFPGFTFLVGVDTLERIIDPVYSPVPVPEILQTFMDCRTTFIVASRPNGERTITLDDYRARIPEKFQGMFIPLPLVADISSNRLRNV